MPWNGQKSFRSAVIPRTRRKNLAISGVLSDICVGTDLDLPAMQWLVSSIGRMCSLMRRRLQKYLPIVLIALMMQVLAPVAACWAAAIATSDPLRIAEICHDSSIAVDQQGDQSGQHREHGGTCSICCLASANASIDTPKIEAFANPYGESAQVVWRDHVPDRSGSRIGSNAQARGPPPLT